MAFAQCKRCGITWEPEKRSELCPSCRVRKSNVIGECIPWQGDYASDLVTPIEDGKPILPGVRSCGHSDCVNANHIVKGNLH